MTEMGDDHLTVGLEPLKLVVSCFKLDLLCNKGYGVDANDEELER